MNVIPWGKCRQSLPRVFFTGYVFLLVLLPVVLLGQEKGYWELWINRQHTDILDVFFKSFTNLGDGLVAVFLIGGFLWIRYADALFLTIGFLLHAFLVHFFKKVCFPGTLRPIAYFEGEPLHRIEGMRNALYHTFPSGHTASIFLFVTSWLLIRPAGKQWQVFWLAVAVLVGFSRVYLLQHFIWDVYAGSLLGIFSAYAGYLFLHSLPQRSWWEGRLELQIGRLRIPGEIKLRKSNASKP
ncbi:phosphatase PAP2 family protein [Cyclobacterium xiamenense]|uniref:phosphatase PAP2 family protein n=1 Tax=Cyclobacterium xiamenense TaxID=1297121 RepID=UPI0012B70BD3|nr:phosphatase PAP2 family protein [Cyclobacterium xiamenense]